MVAMNKFRVIGCALALTGGMGASSPKVEKSATIPWEFGNQPIPEYQNGLLLARDTDHRTVRFFDTTGKLRGHVVLSVPDAAVTSTRSMAAAPDGGVAVAASVKNADGASASVIIWLNASGGVERVVRTTPFAAFHLAFAGDGTLWAVGREHDTRFEHTAEHNILRRYDRQGRVVSSLLPKTSFHVPPGPWHPASQSWLTASGDRVGFYSVTAGEWVEASLSGEILGRWKPGGIKPGEDVLGVALTTSGGVYVSTQIQRVRQTPVYCLDKAANEFVRVQMGDLAEPYHGWVKVLGSDGEDVVFYARPPTTLIWARLH
jgi:hypothetical protein